MVLSVAFFVIAVSFILNILFNKGEKKLVTATIVEVYNNDSWGCGGSMTTIKTEEGFVYKICGSYCVVGNKFKGYWTEGAVEKSLNGFSVAK